MSTGQLVELTTLVLFCLQFQDSKQNDDWVAGNKKMSTVLLSAFFLERVPLSQGPIDSIQ